MRDVGSGAVVHHGRAVVFAVALAAAGGASPQSYGAADPCDHQPIADVAYVERFAADMAGLAGAATDPRAEGLPEFNFSVSTGFRWLNQGAIRLIRQEQAAGLTPPHWMAVIPGESEQWGHHCAPPVERDVGDDNMLSCKFRDRLDKAFQLLRSGQTRFLFATGGWMSGGRADYNEALRARRYLVEHYAAEWARDHGGEDLWNRIIVEPQAQTSTDNVRNAAHFSSAVGFRNFLVVTEMPATAGLMQRNASQYRKQGFYFENCAMSTFNLRSMYAYNMDDSPGGECRRTEPLPLGDGISEPFVEFSGFNEDGAVPLPFAFDDATYDPWAKPAGFPNHLCSRGSVGCSGCMRRDEDRSACASPEIPNP